MTPHLHSEFVEGCYRCDLSRDEERRAARETQLDDMYEAVGNWLVAHGIEVDINFAEFTAIITALEDADYAVKPKRWIDTKEADELFRGGAES